jgi:hypothetical protein
MNEEVVVGLYHCLVDALDARGHGPERPLKVSQLYQELVPYSAVRGPLDLELNADYEHALLRLLAGERRLVRLEPSQARDELKREAEQPFPTVGLFRKFAASDVWVGRAGEAVVPDADREPDHEPDHEPDDEPDHEPDDHARETLQLHFPEPAPMPDRAAPLTGGAVPLRKTARKTAAEPARDASRDPVHELAESHSDCSFCGDSLPPGRRVRFCPFCGADQRLRPCPRCDAVLERAWRYCIACGRDAPTP